MSLDIYLFMLKLERQPSLKFALIHAYYIIIRKGECPLGSIADWRKAIERFIEMKEEFPSRER